MGDHVAVDMAQESHSNVVKAAGGLRPEETLEYRRAFPLGPEGFFEGLVIDDHLGLQFLPIKVSSPGWKSRLATMPGRDKEVFERTEAMYSKVVFFNPSPEKSSKSHRL